MKNEEEEKISEKEKEKERKQKIPIPKYKSFNEKRNNKDKQTTKNTNIINNLINENIILSILFFKKYKPIKLIGEGTFSSVYEGINIKDDSKVALKIEQKKSKITLLKEEALSIFNLQGYGIIKFISFGHSKDYNVLIEPLLGKSLYALYLESKKSFTLKDICHISIQCLDRIEHIHSKGYIHGDIKPENFLIGKNDPRIIYIIDFGLSKKYRSDRTGKHIQFCITKKMTGTARYASTNSLRGVQISRRDDLESLAYMILYFIMTKLPWQGVKANNQQNRYKKIYYMKKKLCENESFKELPIEIQNFYKNIKKLKFEEEPNYSLLRQYFKDLLKINSFNEDDNFSWINDKSLIDTKLEPDLRKRKSNSQKRLMDKLKKNSINDDDDKSFEENNIHINTSKRKSISNSKNILINNDYIYNSNNKEIKSINEAIIDVGDYSDNDEENIIKNKLKEKKNSLKKNNSDFRKKQSFNKEINVNDIMKEYHSNNNFINTKNEDNKDNNIKDFNEYQIKKYTSFRQQNNLNVQTDNGNKINNGKRGNDYNRCNIGKNYMINEMKENKNLENNIRCKDENNIKDYNLKTINNNNKKRYFSENKKKIRSKSGEKCLIQ